MKLTAKRWTVEASSTSLYEFANERGWTDGLPIIPPTAELVTAMLQGTLRDPSDVVAILPPRNGKATVEKIAINAVMAGCKPEYMPILVTAVAAIGRPQMNLMHIQTTTSPAAPLIIVHGPIAEKVGMNWGSDALGPGNRANASIGRAMRLILINIGGGIPGITDKATHGQGAKFSFCTAECGPGNPWPPLHVDKGFDAGASAVTIFPTTGPEDVGPGGAITDPEEILPYIANTMTRWGTLVMRDAPGHLLVLLALGHVQLSFAPNGWTKRNIQEYLFEHARIDAGTVPHKMLRYRAKSGKDPGLFDGKLSPVRSPEDIYVVVAGGHEAHHILVLPGAPAWEPVTELITDEAVIG